MKPDSTRPHHDAPADDPRRWLSALADGDPEALTRGCTLWREDQHSRKTWHAYHLIGDVLRSEDLAHAPRRDMDFLCAVRARLAQEPVLLAPAAAVGRIQPARRHLSWRLPAAAAAGVMVVASVLVVARSGDSGVQAGAPALAAASSAGITLVGANARHLPLAPRAGDGGVIRDARLDEYLRAHQAARGGVAVAAPGGTLRRVEAVVPVSAER